MSDHVLFWDIDLTLLSTARAGIFALEDAAREVLGADPDYGELRTAGLTDSQIARMLIERHGVEESPETVAAFLRTYEGRLPARLPERQGRVLDGVHEILDDVRERPGVHSLLLTGNTQAGAAAKLTQYGLDGYFENGAFCMDMDDRDAIARRALDVAAQVLGEPPDLDRTFVIGDTPHDIASGNAIGVRTIGIASGVVTADELERHDPWLVWERLPDPDGFAQALGLPARLASRPPRRQALPETGPAPGAVEEAARRSPLVRGPHFTDLARADELEFRDVIEPELRGRDVVAWMERKELVPKLRWILERTHVSPRGTVVELGAGTCWLSATLALNQEVDRVIGVEFSRWRLEELAPIAIAAVEAPPEKIERRLADFNDPGLDDAIADLVVFDASFHHAADRPRLASVAHRLLRPGGTVLLFREPTRALLRRGRDHGVEDDYGSFEEEETARGYMTILRDAGFRSVRKVPAAGSFRGARARATLRPPLSWLNGFAFAEFAYLGQATGSRPKQ